MRISMVAAVQLLRLGKDGNPNCTDDANLLPTEGTDTTMLCPVCSMRHSSRRMTVNLDFEKNVYNCIRCKSFYGTARDLIGYYTGWQKDSIEKRVENGELGDLSKLVNESEAAMDAPGKELAPLNRRHEVYEAMMGQLTLSDAHKERLIKRGLTEEQIELAGYRSTPVFLDVSAIPQRLITMGLDLRHVPGFGLNKFGAWEMAKTSSGFFIPGRNAYWMTQGFQIRADYPCYSTPKYGYFSSRRMSCGASCETWPHWAGPNLQNWDARNSFDIIIIEGWLKGDICHYRTGSNFLCVPGVTSLKKLFPALASFRKKGLVRDIYIAYDMDAYENEDVARQLVALYFKLKRDGYSVRILQWESEFKGLDDWLTGSAQPAQNMS